MSESCEVASEGYPLEHLALAEYEGDCADYATYGLVEPAGGAAQQNEPEDAAVEQEAGGSERGLG